MKKELDAYTRIHTIMGAARQLIKGATTDKLAYLMQTLPQRIVDGQFINYNGDSIGGTDLADQELVKAERLIDASQITDKLLNDLFHPLNTVIFVDPEKESEEYFIETKSDKKKSKKETEEIVDKDYDPEKYLQKAIKKGNKKKASKQLEMLKPSLSKKAFKKYKKQVKGL